MLVFTARAVTDSGDNYIFVYESQPTRDMVIRRVHELEGAGLTLKWYGDTTSVYIDETMLIKEAPCTQS